MKFKAECININGLTFNIDESSDEARVTNDGDDVILSESETDQLISNGVKRIIVTDKSGNSMTMTIEKGKTFIPSEVLTTSYSRFSNIKTILLITVIIIGLVLLYFVFYNMKLLYDYKSGNSLHLKII